MPIQYSNKNPRINMLWGTGTVPQHVKLSVFIIVWDAVRDKPHSMMWILCYSFTIVSSGGGPSSRGWCIIHMRLTLCCKTVWGSTEGQRPSDVMPPRAVRAHYMLRPYSPISTGRGQWPFPRIMWGGRGSLCWILYGHRYLVSLRWGWKIFILKGFVDFVWKYI